MTLLTRRLSREIDATLDVDKMSRGRPIIIEMEGDLITFRWKGTRRRYTATVPRLMQWTIAATVEAERRAKRAARKVERRQ